VANQKEYNQCVLVKRCAECLHNDFCKAWVDFVLMHNSKKTYSHFDKRVSLALPIIRRYVMNGKNVATHSFHPFIYFQKKNLRFGKTKKFVTCITVLT
jgi:hypothetical protein